MLDERRQRTFFIGLFKDKPVFAFPEACCEKPLPNLDITVTDTKRYINRGALKCRFEGVYFMPGLFSRVKSLGLPWPMNLKFSFQLFYLLSLTGYEKSPTAIGNVA